jgi:hypothetical protein
MSVEENLKTALVVLINLVAILAKVKADLNGRRLETIRLSRRSYTPEIINHMVKLFLCRRLLKVIKRISPLGLVLVVMLIVMVVTG